MTWTHRGGNAWTAHSGTSVIGGIYEVAGQLNWWFGFNNEFGRATTVKEGKRRLADAWANWLVATGLREIA